MASGGSAGFRFHGAESGSKGSAAWPAPSAPPRAVRRGNFFQPKLCSGRGARERDAARPRPRACATAGGPGAQGSMRPRPPAQRAKNVLLNKSNNYLIAQGEKFETTATTFAFTVAPHHKGLALPRDRPRTRRARPPTQSLPANTRESAIHVSEKIWSSSRSFFVFEIEFEP